MGALIDARTEVADTIRAAGVTAHPHLPGRLVPPCAIVTGGSPLLTSAAVFGLFEVRHDVQVVGLPQASDTAQDALDALTESAVVALVAGGYGVESVSAPYRLVSGSGEYPAVTISVTSEISLES